MRSIRFTLAIFLLCSGVALAAENQRPQFRPAVLRSGAESLANQIDAKGLALKGQKDGAIMFCAVVSETGEATSSWTYRGLHGTEALDEELSRRLETAKFTPPIYNHQPVSVLLFGTLLFFLEGETPHLRILLSQDPGEIKEEADFISPQPVIGADSGFHGLQLGDVQMPVLMTAVVDLGIKVDENGNLKDLRLLHEEPPLLGFGDAALANFKGAKFIPAFRSGIVTACEVVYPVAYKAVPPPPQEESQ